MALRANFLGKPFSSSGGTRESDDQIVSSYSWLTGKAEVRLLTQDSNHLRDAHWH